MAETKETFQKKFSCKERYDGYSWLVMHVLPKNFCTLELVRGHKLSRYVTKDLFIEVIVDSYRAPACAKRALGENGVIIGKLEIDKTIHLGLEPDPASVIRNIINCTLNWLLSKDIPRLNFRRGEENIQIEYVEDLRLLWEQIGIEREKIEINRIEDLKLKLWEQTGLSAPNKDNLDKLRKYFQKQHLKNLKDLEAKEAPAFQARQGEDKTPTKIAQQTIQVYHIVGTTVGIFTLFLYVDVTWPYYGFIITFGATILGAIVCIVTAFLLFVCPKINIVLSWTGRKSIILSLLIILIALVFIANFSLLFAWLMGIFRK